MPKKNRIISKTVKKIQNISRNCTNCIMRTVFHRGDFKYYFISVSNNKKVYMKTDFSPYEVSGYSDARNAYEATLHTDISDNEITEPVIYHAYWHGAVGRLQVASLKSVLATQLSYPIEVWLWLDEETLDQNGEDNIWLNGIRDKIKIKLFNTDMIKNTEHYKNVIEIYENPINLAACGDNLRLWALYTYGGVYFDLDVLFLKDISTLIKKEEFVYAWEKQPFANSAVLYLKKESETNEYIAEKVEKKKCTQPWCIFGYRDKKLSSMRLYVASLFDPLWNDYAKEYPIHSLDDFFLKPLGDDIDIENCFPFSYAYHWHNRWKTEIDEKSLFARLERSQSEIVERK